MIIRPMARVNEWISVVAQTNHIPQHIFCLESIDFIGLVGYFFVRPVARNYIFSVIWRCYGPKRDILDY